MMWLYVILLVLPGLLSAQNDCFHGACYPAVGDLLIGRTNYLKVSSTCGLVKPETYCTPYGETQLKCCRCDSREPFTEISHRIVNVLSPIGQQRWWQSENGVDHVTLQFDLDRRFQLSDITLDFRSPKPAGMSMERSSDYGRTWQVYQYLAYDCAATFPHISRGRPHNLEDVRCQELQGHPTQGGQVRFSPMELAPSVPASQRTYRLGEFTNVRVNFTQLVRLPARRYRQPNAFYAVNEMRVRGTCLCYGHANQCVPSGIQGRDPYGDIQVHDTCVCQHNTVGSNCERCADLYNDLPWRPAEENNPNECKKCDCNNHSDKCRFDPAVYEASGRVSGGVCEDCRDGTTGRNCERCKSDYYRNPNRDMNHRDACISCDCDPEGSVEGGSCDSMTGRCNCKENVGGERCDQCKPGYYQFSASNPQGCTRCVCNPQGTQGNHQCDSETGQCQCLPGVSGLQCDQCASNHWNFVSGKGCQLCGCHPRNSYSLQCNQVTGQCLCREGFGGRLCTECPDRTYGTLQTGCRACNCDPQGTIDIGCDKATGRCLCRPGFVGARCDSCERGYSDTFPNCIACHSCFQFYDHEFKALGSHLQTLRNTSAAEGGEWDLDLGPQMAGVESELQRISGIFTGSGILDSELSRMDNQLKRIRGEAQQLNPDLPPAEDIDSLTTDLNSLRLEFNNINVLYQNKKTQQGSSTSVDSSGLLRAVSTAYQSSLESAERVAAAEVIVSQSRESRRTAQNLEGKIRDEHSDLETMKEELSYPNLTPTINRICEGVRTESCTPENCPGTLCQRNNETLCKVGSLCRGAFPLSMNALKNTEKTARDLQELNNQLQKNTQMINQAEKTANQIQDSAQHLTEQVTRARTRMEEDMGRTRQFIQQVRDFLTEPTTDPATIQEVSEYVLSLTLPADSATILRKMNEIRSIASKLPNIDSVLSQTKDDIAKAKKLQSEAELARNKAMDVEGNVDGVIMNLRNAKTALLEAEDKIRGTGTSLMQIQDRMEEIQDVLGPAERGLTGTHDQLQGFSLQIENLRQKTTESLQKAGKAQQAALSAHGKAENAQEGLALVKDKYALLKSRMGQNPNLGAQGEKVASIQAEADSLFKESVEMMNRMAEIESELQEGRQSLIMKFTQLGGLEEEVRNIRDYISEKAHYYANCK
ncbi:laminin subunit beta-3 [Spea bombifrons]|uniref:laminin subunit beta-3 n=1 Tax=Spea bombifrons TaxID=233779 RepID=UPI002349E068|nr:laminin subunit beta-3 [Spea bombifrons]